MRNLGSILKIAIIGLPCVLLLQGSTFDFVSYAISNATPRIAKPESIQSSPSTLPMVNPLISRPHSANATQEDVSQEADGSYSISLEEILIEALAYADRVQTAPHGAQAEESVGRETPFFEIGKHLKLLPDKTEPVVEFPGGMIQFVAQLENPYRDRSWHVQVEAIVTHDDGTTRTAVKAQSIRLFPGQLLEIPVKFKAKASKYQPGLTRFTAFIKDMSGEIIDQATIAFNLEKRAE